MAVSAWWSFQRSSSAPWRFPARISIRADSDELDDASTFDPSSASWLTDAARSARPSSIRLSIAVSSASTPRMKALACADPSRPVRAARSSGRWPRRRASVRRAPPGHTRRRRASRSGGCRPAGRDGRPVLPPERTPRTRRRCHAGRRAAATPGRGRRGRRRRRRREGFAGRPHRHARPSRRPHRDRGWSRAGRARPWRPAGRRQPSGRLAAAGWPHRRHRRSRARSGPRRGPPRSAARSAPSSRSAEARRRRLAAADMSPRASARLPADPSRSDARLRSARPWSSSGPRSAR